MDWNQIESKWALMARRIRADAPCRNMQKTMGLRDAQAKSDLTRSNALKKNVAIDIEVTRKRVTVSRLDYK